MAFRFVGVLTTVSLATITMIACGGKIVSIGTESNPLLFVAGAVTVATTACPQGFEHPNVCCAGDLPTCISYPNGPFLPCDGTTYPLAETCCSLDDPSNCIPQATDAGDEDAGAAATCEVRCPPGYSGTSPYDPNGCCNYPDDQEGTCFGEGPAYADDAECAKTESCEVDAGPPSACAFDCPDGWFVEDAIDGLCCKQGVTTTDEECFAVVFPSDNGSRVVASPDP